MLDIMCDFTSEVTDSLMSQLLAKSNHSYDFDGSMSLTRICFHVR